MSRKPNFEAIVERAKLEIMGDVQNGTHPALVQCFSDLHSFADANACGGGDDAIGNTPFWKKVHERLDAWIQTAPESDEHKSPMERGDFSLERALAM